MRSEKAMLPGSLPFSGIKLGIVCPMANEHRTATRFVNEVIDQCSPDRFDSVTFFAVLDNASKDGTRDLLAELQDEQSHLTVVWAPENKNVVDAYIRGYHEAVNAGCDWILEIDAGYSHQPADIPKFFAAMSEEYDCVFGSRFCSGGDVTETSLKRRLLSRGGSLLTNSILGTRLTDMTSGFELFSRSALQAVLARGIHSRGHFFQTEIKTYCRKLRITEVPIHYRAASNSVTNKVLVDAAKNLWRLFRLRVAGRL